MIKYIIMLFLIVPNIANATCLKPTAVQGAIADTITTIGGIEFFGLTETNPIGFIGSSLVKIITLYRTKDYIKEEEQKFNSLAGAFWAGAAINNLMVIIGAANPVAILAGVSSGLIFYNMPECEKKDD